MRMNPGSYIFAAILLVFIFAGALLHCGKSPARQVVIIVLDAARPDRFSFGGYEKPTTPEMDKLAAGGAFFSNCYVQGTTTRTSLPSLLYSRYFLKTLFPNHPSVPYASPAELFRRLDDQAVSIPKAFREAGFLTAAVIAHEWFTEGTPLARDFAEFFNLHTLVEYDPKYAYPRADRVTDFVLAWVKKNRRRDFFLYVHIMDTHFPHHFENDARMFFKAEDYDASAKFAPSGMPWDARGDFAETDIEYLNALYDGSLRFTDREVGRMADGFRRGGLLSDMLLVITADHGEFLLEKPGLVGHGADWYDPLAKVPLIMHHPAGFGPRTFGTLCELVDVGPTILELMNVSLPDGKAMDGEDLSGIIRTGRDVEGRAAFIGMGYSGIRTDRYKGLFRIPVGRILSGTEGARDVRQDIKAELYHILEDPGENSDLATSLPDIVEDLAELYRSKMAAPYKRYQEAVTKSPPEDAFAISASSFRPEKRVPGNSLTEDPGVLRAEAAPGGWIRRSSWDNSWLFAVPGAGPLTISFPLPNGKYLLSIDMNGACVLETGGISRSFKTKTFASNLRWTTDSADFGVIEVRDEVFRAVIMPEFEDAPWFAVRLFGFDPLVEGRIPRLEDKEKDRRREERLRSLGYIR